MSQTTSWLAVIIQIARWTARALGVGLFLLFAAFVVGEGFPPLNWLTVALLVAMSGFVLAWFHDLLAGMVILVGIGAFYLINFSQYGRFPGGPVFPLLFVPGILLIASGLLRGRRHKSAV